MNRKSKDPGRAVVGRTPDDAELHRLKAPHGAEPKADDPLPPDIAVIAASRLAKAAARAATMLTGVPGVNLAYRPKTYFWSRGLNAHLPARAKQSSRMTALQRFIVGDHLDESANDFPESDQGPNFRFEEVLIARITISSAGRDVTCVYARIDEDCIHYEVVDEYLGRALAHSRECTSREPPGEGNERRQSTVASRLAMLCGVVRFSCGQWQGARNLVRLRRLLA